MEKEFKRINYNNELFKKNLDFLTRKNGISKNKIETELEMSIGGLSRYCKIDGKAPIPSIEIISNIANVFKVKIDELVNEDLEKKEEQEMKNKERREVLFCEKLIQDTKNNLCEWNYYCLDGGAPEYYYNTIFLQSPYEPEIKFYSRFLEKEYCCEEPKILIGNINTNIKVLIAKLPFDKENNEYSYELYLIKDDEKVLPSCSSHSYEDGLLSKIYDEKPLFDDYLYNILRTLYETANDYISFGKEKFEIEEIYNEYLFPTEMPF